MRKFLATGLLAAVAAWPVHAQLKPSTPAEQALDAAAFQGVQRVLDERFTDIQSVVVVLQDRVVFAFHRDGQPDALRDIQSVEKSALAALVGVALAQGHLASLDQPVASLLPAAWAAEQDDPRAAAITLRHLLTMTAGFAPGNQRSRSARAAWTRPLASAPGERFAYDNGAVPLVAAVLEAATGQKVPDYARRQLLAPMDIMEPAFRPGLYLRTLDMAKLGLLFLRDGRWSGRQLLPAQFVAEATRVQTAGGPPVGMPYGFFWWVLPQEARRRTFLGSGFSGQMVWVHPPLDLVVAVTSTVSAQPRAPIQATQLLRAGLVDAAARRAGR